MEPLEYRLGRIDTKLDQVIQWQADRDNRDDRTERRVNVLERAHWKLIGIVTGVSAVVTLLSAILFKK